MEEELEGISPGRESDLGIVVLIHFYFIMISEYLTINRLNFIVFLSLIPGLNGLEAD